MKVVAKQVGKNRWYIDEDRGGQRIPGVTTIVKDGMPKPQLMNWHANATADYTLDHWDELAALPASERLARMKKGRYEFRDSAGDKGRLIHRCAEDLMDGKKVAIPEGLEAYVRACVRFLNQFDLMPIMVETVVYSETDYYCGRPDVIGSVLLPETPDFDYIPRDENGRSVGLFDWKSAASGIWGDLAYQLAPYRFAEFALLPDGEVTEVPQVDFCAGIHLRRDGRFSVDPVQVDRQQYEDFLVFKRVAEIAERTKGLVREPITPPLENRFEIVRIDENEAPA